jgi:hypothetical protein
MMLFLVAAIKKGGSLMIQVAAHARAADDDGERR